MIDLLLLTPIVAVLVVAAVVVHRERRPAPAPEREDDDLLVDLTFLRATPREIDLRIADLRSEAHGSLGARMRTVQLAQEASTRPVVHTRRRRQRPLVASR